MKTLYPLLLPAFFFAGLCPRAFPDDRPRAREAPQPAPSAPAKGPGGIVAIVGDDVITQTELDERLERRRSELSSRFPTSFVEAEMPRQSRWVLEQMIDDKLILQLVKKEDEKEGKPYISEADIDAQITFEVKRLHDKGADVSEPEDLYRLVSERDKLSREKYRAFLKETLARNKYLWHKVFRQSGGFASPNELRSYYLSHLDEFTNPVKVSFRQIIVKPSRDAGLIVERVENALKAGQPFVELAKEVAEAQGGDPGGAGSLLEKSFEELKDWREPIREALRHMKKGEISEKLALQEGGKMVGILWLKVEEVIEGKPKPYSEVQTEIEERIREEYNRAELDAFLAKLRKKKRIEIFLPPEPKVAKKEERAPATQEKSGSQGAPQPSAEPEPPGGARATDGSPKERPGG